MSKQSELAEVQAADSELRKIIIKLINYLMKGEPMEGHPSVRTRLNPKEAEQAILDLHNKQVAKVAEEQRLEGMNMAKQSLIYKEDDRSVDLLIGIQKRRIANLEAERTRLEAEL